MKSSPAVARGVVVRDFLWTLIRTDFQVRYHGALGGFVWALAKPVVMFSVLYTVFRFLFPESNYGINLLVGILLWSFFSEGTAVGIESLFRKSFLITKAKFPRWIVVVAAIVNPLLTLVVNAVALVLVVSITRGVPSPLHLLLFLLYLVLYAIVVLGLALGGCALFLKYRDLNQVWDVVLQAGFFVAPIMYPIATLPERYREWIFLWPVTPILQFSRAVLVSGVTPTLRAHLLLLLGVGGIFLVGTQLYRRYLNEAMETL